VSGNKFDKLNDAFATGTLKSTSQYVFSFLQDESVRKRMMNKKKNLKNIYSFSLI
jgi:hypothetical protein